MGMLLRALRLSLVFLLRDWRAGELRILILAIALAVGSASAVGFFVDRVERALAGNASELLAADLRIASDHPITADYLKRAHELGLQSALLHGFRTMAVSGNGAQLVEMKAASQGYPLRGAVRIAVEPFGAERPSQGIPQPGEIWVEQRLLGMLGLQIGEPLSLGERSFTVAAILTYEPDRAGDLFSIAPRVLINDVDLASTRLMQEGSRVAYRLLVAGESSAVAAFRNFVTARLQRGERIEDVKDARPEVRTALERAHQFLALAAMVSVIVAGVALALAARRFSERHLDNYAVMRCLGGQQRLIIAVYTLEIFWAGLGGSTLGCLLGYAAQTVLADLLGVLVIDTLPAPSWHPALSGIAVGIVVVIGFVVPSLVSLARVPTIRVLRRDLGPPGTTAALGWVLGIGAVAALIWMQIRALDLVLVALLGLLAAGMVFVVLAAAFVFALRRLVDHSRGSWRVGMASLTRRSAATVLQIAAFGIGMTVLLLLSLVRSDILSAWQQRIPDDAPNYFMINVQPDQVAGLGHFMREQLETDPIFYPMIRGRLVSINDRPVSADNYAEDRAARLAERETNLTWSADLPRGNELVSGQWWTVATTAEPVFSIEEGIAQSLGIRRGDHLVYNVSGEMIAGTVVNLRKVNWDSFNANFFVIAAPGMLDAYPANYIASVFVPQSYRANLDELARTFPGVTLIDVSAIMNQVRTIMDRVALAVEYVFIFALIAGFLVMFAAIQATQDQRLRQSAILRSLGAGNRTLLGSLAAEFVVLGAISGLVAAFAANLLSFLLSEWVFALEYRFNPWLWLVGLFSGAVGVGIAGIWGTRRTLREPPLRVLGAA